MSYPCISYCNCSLVISWPNISFRLAITIECTSPALGRKRHRSLKILLLDIETAPHKVYSWGLWNQDINPDNIIEQGYTLCWAAKWRGQKQVMFNSIQESSRKKMVKEIYGLICDADAIVHYNGTKFDMPILNQEFLFDSLAPPT